MLRGWGEQCEKWLEDIFSLESLMGSFVMASFRRRYLTWVIVTDLAASATASHSSSL
jgi:hypothetical protein